MILQALAGYDPRDAESNLAPVADYFAFASPNPRGLRVAVSYDFGRGFAMDGEALALVREMARFFEDAGCIVVEADPPTSMNRRSWSRASGRTQATTTLPPRR